MKNKVQNIYNLFLSLLPAFIIVFIIVIFAVVATNLLYAKKSVIVRGYEIKLSPDGKLIKTAEKEVNFSELMKLADVENGKKIFKKCASCHKIEKNAGNGVGPNLNKVIGRNRGSVTDFSYSKAMISLGGKWTKEEINKFITNPKEYLPNTKMAFAGLKKAQQRADVIKYLESVDN